MSTLREPRVRCKGYKFTTYWWRNCRINIKIIVNIIVYFDYRVGVRLKIVNIFSVVCLVGDVMCGRRGFL